MRLTRHVALLVSALSLAGPVSAQSLVAANVDTAKHQANVPVVLSYLPGADSGSFDFELRYPEFVTALPSVTHNIPNGALSCRLPAPGRLRCVVVSASAALDLGAGTLTVPFATAGTNGSAALSFEFAHFFAQSGARETGSTSPGSLNVGAQPALSIDNLAVVEGASGTSVASFTVTLAPVAPGPVSFDIATETGTAMPGVDYVAQALTGQVIPAGQAAYSFNVTINGDTLVEANETFPVRLTNVSGAAVSDGEAIARIVNDDQAILSISDAVVTEGHAGDVTARFLVSLSTPMPTPVTFNIATAGGSAQSNTDFASKSQVARMVDAGRSSTVFEVAVLGDLLDEPDETFSVTLSGVSGAILGDATGVGTIVDDDGAAVVSIADIQGTGASSPLIGTTLSTEGIVTALTADGFYLQSANAAVGRASTGIAVLSPERDIAVGDWRRVDGKVEEASAWLSRDAGTLTRIAASRTQRLDRLRALPQPVRLDAGNAGSRQVDAGLERYEGMRVSIPWLHVVGPSAGVIDATGRLRDIGSFHGVVRGVARPFLEPGASVLGLPSPKAGRPRLFDGNPERLRIDSGAQRGAAPIAVDAGDHVAGLVGVLGYADGAYELLPDPGAQVQVASNANPRAVPAAADGETSVALVNLARRSSDPIARVPTDPLSDAYAVRLAKAANLICALAGAPDIVAITGLHSHAELVELERAINDRDGDLLLPGGCPDSPGYESVQSPGLPHRGLGFLVRAERAVGSGPRVKVLAVSELAWPRPVPGEGRNHRPDFPATLLLDAVLQPGSGQPLRLGLVATALEALPYRNAGAVHASRQREDAVRARRLVQAQTLGRALREWQRARPEQALMVLGSFDAPEFSDGYADTLNVVAGGRDNANAGSTRAASAAGLINLTTHLPPAERYTVVREGNAQARDHVLVSPSLRTSIPGARISMVRANADFGADNADDPSVPMAVSDHDPVVVVLPLRY